MDDSPQLPHVSPQRKGLSIRTVIAIVIAAVLVTGALGYIFLAKPASAQVVRYERPTTTGADPFTPPAVASAPKAAFANSKQPFGGSGDIKVCDREKLIAFLNSHLAQKQAWLDVLGVEAKNFERYVRSLTPVILQKDVRVTNHGFKDGHIYDLQSVLAAGTAVLADRSGGIVVKCYCGNPLTPPVITTDKTTCEDCPPGVVPPPPCTGDCYECPDTGVCPSPAPIDPCPSDGCPEATDPNDYSVETPVPDFSYNTNDNGSQDTSPPGYQQSTDTNTDNSTPAP